MCIWPVGSIIWNQFHLTTFGIGRDITFMLILFGCSPNDIILIDFLECFFTTQCHRYTEECCEVCIVMSLYFEDCITLDNTFLFLFFRRLNLLQLVFIKGFYYPDFRHIKWRSKSLPNISICYRRNEINFAIDGIFACIQDLVFRLWSYRSWRHAHIVSQHIF